jgi:hypothetical protein
MTGSDLEVQEFVNSSFYCGESPSELLRSLERKLQQGLVAKALGAAMGVRLVSWQRLYKIIVRGHAI